MKKKKGAERINADRIDEHYYYAGDDLGAVYTPTQTVFTVWAPTAREVRLCTYPQGRGGVKTVYPMAREKGGIWRGQVDGDCHGLYYTYAVTHEDSVYEVVDPYARAAGVNGDRGMVVDLDRTNPEGWNATKGPALDAMVDAIIYEVHVRDFSTYPQSGIEQKGRFLAFTEAGTRGPQGVRTGLDHLVDLGITHLHLLPIFDFASVDEADQEHPQFNWGYDPKNFNVPEGSYATDPFDGAVRIRELKAAIQSLHQRKIGVIMDVVYNHTYKAWDSNLNRLVPGYYYRMNPDRSFANGSGCGNELATERPMVRKLILDSVVYWAREYRLDGFRFDLMGLFDLETMRQIRQALDRVAPGLIIYGEGWTGGPSPLPGEQAALKGNAPHVPGIAFFNDSARDGIKGDVFNGPEPGFISGRLGLEESVKFGIVAATAHPQLCYERVNYDHGPWAVAPGQAVVYCEAHDNLTLWDKLALTNPEEPETLRIQRHKLAGAIVLTSQGIPFLHAGQEFLRTKGGNANSYLASDEINQLDWARKARYEEVYTYYRGLIALRKAHPAFRLRTTEQIQTHLRFLELPPQLIGYTLGEHANGDSWRMIVVLFNAHCNPVTVALPGDDWVVVVDQQRAGTEALTSHHSAQVAVPPLSALVLVDRASFEQSTGC
ncbi:MAG TPA: type I pullulanase [Hydrogenispora sp.]|nr:type I pullulanase [Hydrogenispora sp.]